MNKRDTEFISAEVPKGTKAKIRLFAVKNGYKNVSEVVRAGLDTIMREKAKEEAVASEIGRI